MPGGQFQHLPGEPPRAVITEGELFVFAQKRFVKISFLRRQKTRLFFCVVGFVSAYWREKCRSSCCFAAWFSSQRETDLPECLQLNKKRRGGGLRGNAVGVCFHQAVGADSCERWRVKTLPGRVPHRSSRRLAPPLRSCERHLQPRSASDTASTSQRRDVRPQNRMSVPLWLSATFINSGAPPPPLPHFFSFFFCSVKLMNCLFIAAVILFYLETQQHWGSRACFFLGFFFFFTNTHKKNSISTISTLLPSYQNTGLSIMFILDNCHIILRKFHVMTEKNIRQKCETMALLCDIFYVII